MLECPNPEQEQNMAYVDGLVVPVPKDKLDAYRDMSRRCAAVWREHGALAYREWVADDVPLGQLTSFPRSVQLKDDEVVVFSWIEYPSRAVRDACNAKVMQDPRMADLMKAGNMPFDGKRLIHGGFDNLVDL
jgi:uncharacterized protein YbaA (DUF1428 family)